jgi:hypothetical protein
MWDHPAVANTDMSPDEKFIEPVRCVTLEATSQAPPSYLRTKFQPAEKPAKNAIDHRELRRTADATTAIDMFMGRMLDGVSGQPLD